ncbi:conserved membrane hypothetical protein [Nitrosopumilaceae archaeon]|nr:hypothetical protein [Nitrosopumilus sp.]MDA7973928.1 hypothetical protein [Nitrosopumilus sp.]MDA7997885.1 hypothetical protein [Nitrosopumilus sp.]CAI9830653.1 conserved membrane hypothetical protein [Nitrosopumilaceae archaeon]
MERHLERSDPAYRVYLYVFYVCAAVMASSFAYGTYITTAEWLEEGTYVMGEAVHNTVVPFENFARVSTWAFFSSIIGWYCVSRIGWRRTTAGKISGVRLALLRMMLLGFAIITGYEVIYNFVVLYAQIEAGTVAGQVPDIDMLYVAYPDPERPWNLVFATKMFLAAFIISAHAFYLSTRPRKPTLEGGG